MISFSMTQSIVGGDPVDRETLSRILNEHKAWLEDHANGRRACLQNRNLEKADLSGEHVSLLFGKETKGLPDWLREKFADRCLRLPMRQGARSLNLSNAAAILTYETLRQQGKLDELFLETVGE